MIESLDKPFHIYRSSAGSGKTYTLTKEYLKIALARPNAFRHILGVTFTNKATEEMKSRIISLLRNIAEGQNPPVQKELQESLGMNEAQIQSAASSTLSDILHQYGRFAVVTIDSFFHQVIRSFAKEMGLQGSFSIDLELDRVMQKVVDDMLLQVGQEDKKTLRKWLTQFAEERVENGEPWDVRREINNLAEQVIKDEFKPYARDVLKLGENPEFFTSLKKEIDQQRFSFENNIKSQCTRAIGLMEQYGVDPSDFKGGSRSPAHLFFRLPDKFEITDAQRSKAGNVSEWIKAKDPKSAQLESVLEAGVMDCYQQIVGLFETKLIAYQSAKEALRYFYTFGVLTEVNKKIQDYRDENDVMLIADLPDFLNQIISDNETPYIYEKVGSRFQNYLIDEFQDTSAFQWENFKPLVKNASDQGDFGMVVGDVKQSIYRWRGGDWQLLQSRLKQDVGDYHVWEETLNTNWRSACQVVGFNNTFFVSSLERADEYFQETLREIIDEGYQEQIKGRIAEVLSTYAGVAQHAASENKDEGMIEIGFVSDDDGEEDEGWKDLAAQRSIKAVEEAQRKGYELRDITILTRTKPEGKKVARAFMEYNSSESADPNLRYEVVSSEALYLTSSHVVRFLISMIKWLNEESNTIVLAEWLFEYEKYIKRTKRKDAEVFSAKEDWMKQVPARFVKERFHLKTLPLYELVERLVDLFELNEFQEEFTYLQGFQDAMLDYSKNERGDIPSFLEWWEEVKKDKTVQLSEANNAVTIMTIHKSKGLEFPIVIIPFLSWELDHGFGNEQILWCKTGDVAPYNQLPVIPLRYSSKLANTYWAMDYYDEKLKAFLDNLNLLYVAFTRPVDALIAFGKLPRPTKGKSEPGLDNLKVKMVSDFVLSILKDQDEFDQSSYTYQKGRWKEGITSKKTGSKEVQLARYTSQSWREKVHVQMKGARELDEAVFNEAARKGVRIHDLISRVKHKKDLEYVLDSPERSFVTKVVEHPNVAAWFDEDWQVDTEVTFLLPNGDFKRVDRINRSTNETIVIDFKTGTAREIDKRQVKGYMDILIRMGYPGVKGCLVYLADMEVEEV